MTWCDKGTAVGAVVLVTLAIGIWAAYRRSNTVPSLPKGVRSDAVFLWAPYAGLPAPRRGWWMSCWESGSGHPLCNLSNIDGATEYQGEFVLYGSTTHSRPKRFEIDPIKSRAHKVWVGHALVPLVFLKSGEILIPAASYDNGKRLLDQSAADGNSPLDPSLEGQP